MRKNGKKIAIKLIVWLIFIGLFIGLCWLNYRKLKDNTYSNYEKALDYGYIKYSREIDDKFLVAVFYRGFEEDNSSLSTFFNYVVKSNLFHAKILLLPEDINTKSYALIDGFFKKITKQNQINKIVLVAQDKQNLGNYKKLVTVYMPNAEIQRFLLENDEEPSSEQFDECLSEDECLLMFAADVNDLDGNRLVNDAVFYAQKMHLRVMVADIYDEQIFSAYATGRTVAKFLSDAKDEVTLQQQKINLEQYVQRYGTELKNYFFANLERASKKEKLCYPERNEENYRLYDRATIYVKAYDSEYNTVLTKLGDNQENALIATLSQIAEETVVYDKEKIIKYYEIYFLTDMEKIAVNEGTDVSEILDYDDGLYVVYNEKSALLLANERPLLSENTVRILREKAQIDNNVTNEKLTFYRFKSVEIDYDTSEGD